MVLVGSGRHENSKRLQLLKAGWKVCGSDTMRKVDGALTFGQKSDCGEHDD